MGYKAELYRQDKVRQLTTRQDETRHFRLALLFLSNKKKKRKKKSDIQHSLQLS